MNYIATSKKTGKSSDPMNEEQLAIFKARPFARNFIVTELAPIKQIIPKLDIVTKETKKITKKKVNET